MGGLLDGLLPVLLGGAREIALRGRVAHIPCALPGLAPAPIWRHGRNARIDPFGGLAVELGISERAVGQPEMRVIQDVVNRIIAIVNNNAARDIRVLLRYKVVDVGLGAESPDIRDPRTFKTLSALYSCSISGETV